MTFRHQALALLVTFIWGTNFVFIRYALDELEPFTLATLRFLIVALPLVFVLPKPKTSWLNLASYGLLIGCGQFGLLFWAMRENISPGLASLIIQMQVFFTIFLAVALLGENIRARQIFALVICFAGLMLIIANTDDQTTLVGVVMTLLAAAGWACGNLVVKHAGKVDIIAFIAWSSLFSVPPLAILAWYFEGLDEIVQSVQNASVRAWVVVLWQSIGNTLLGYGLWNMLLNRYTAATVAPWAILVPVFGVSASALLLSEPLPWWKLVAVGLILIGLIVNMSGSHKDMMAQTKGP